MSIEVTLRHMRKGEKIQEYAWDKAVELLDSFPRLESVHVVLDLEKHFFKAEVIVQGKNRIRVEASESADKLKVSVDVAFDRVEKQLRKRNKKVQGKKRHTARHKDAV